MPWCGCVEHLLQYIVFYAQKHIAYLAAFSWPTLVGDRLLGAPASLKLAYYSDMTFHRNENIHLVLHKTSATELYWKLRVYYILMDSLDNVD